MSKEVRRLGRGIASLVSSELSGLGGTAPPPAPIAPIHTESAPTPAQATVNRLANLPVKSIRPNPAQPRRHFNDEAIKSLAESLRRRGALQPITVRPAEGGYELIAGERRLRAAILAGIETIPAIVRAVKDDDLLELALIENIQRQDLNPVERAQAYKALQTRHGLTQDQIGERMGEDRATVSNYMRLLELHEDVLRFLAGGQLSMGHARALVGIVDKKTQLSFATRVVSEGWSVRRVEAAAGLLKHAGGAGGTRQEKSSKQRPQVAEMEQRLREHLGTRVAIREGRKQHTGRITIEYYSLDDFDRIVAQLGIAREPA